MHAVCDEHGSHSFKSDGWPARRPRVQEVISNEEKKYQQTELGGHQHVNARGILARTPCRGEAKIRPFKVGLGILQITSSKRCPQVWPCFGRSLFSTDFVEFDPAV